MMVIIYYGHHILKQIQQEGSGAENAVRKMMKIRNKSSRFNCTYRMGEIEE